MRLSSLVALCAALMSFVTVPAHAAIPPQEPGVTLRTFDMQVALTGSAPSNPGRRPTSTS